MIRNNGMAAIANISGMASPFHLPSRTSMVPLAENQAPGREADKRLLGADSMATSRQSNLAAVCLAAADLAGLKKVLYP
jgi:hypothetical protein